MGLACDNLNSNLCGFRTKQKLIKVCNRSILTMATITRYGGTDLVKYTASNGTESAKNSNSDISINKLDIFHVCF